MNRHSEEPVLVYSDHVLQLSTAVLRLLSDQTDDVPIDLQDGVQLFEAGKYDEVVDRVSCSSENHRILIATHLLRGLALLQSAKLQDVLSEEEALEAMDHGTAEAFRQCYRIPPGVRQLLSGCIPNSPIPVQRQSACKC